MSASFTQTRNQIIFAALRKLGIGNEGETVTASAVNDSSDGLNRVLREISARETKFWKDIEIMIFYKAFIQNVAPIFSLGPTGDRACYRNELITSQVGVTAIASATSLTLNYTTGVQANWNIGIQQDDNTLFWSTVVSVVGNVVTISTPLPTSSQINSSVFSYITPIARPTMLHGGRINISTYPAYTVKTLLNQIGSQDYMILPFETMQNRSNQFFYQATLRNGELRVWPVPESPIYVLGFTAEMPLNDALLASDVLDIPPEWISYITYALAIEMAPEFSIGADKMQPILQKYQEQKQLIENLTSDKASVILRPDSNIWY